MKKYLTSSQRIIRLKETLKGLSGKEKQEYERQLEQAQAQEKRETFKFKAKKQNSKGNSINLSIREPTSHENTESQAITPPQEYESQTEREGRILNLFSRSF